MMKAENIKNKYKKTSICTAVAIAIGAGSFGVQAALINDYKYSKGETVFNNANLSHQLSGLELDNYELYGDFNQNFILNTTGGKVKFNLPDNSYDRVLLVTGKGKTTDGSNVPTLTVDGSVTVDKFISKTSQLNLGLDSTGAAVKTYAVIQVGTSRGSWSNGRARGHLKIQGDLTLNGISRGNATGKYIGSGVYVEHGSSLSLKKADGSFGNITLKDSAFTSFAISMGASSYDKREAGPSLQANDITLSNVKADKAIDSFGGHLQAGNVTVDDSVFDSQVFKFYGRQQAENKRSTVKLNDVFVNNVTVSQDALYIGTSNPKDSNATNQANGSVNADIGNITISGVTATSFTESALVFINNNTDSTISIGDISIKNANCSEKTNQGVNSLVRFRNNKDVSLKTGVITIKHSSLNKGSSGRLLGDKLAAISIENQVNNLKSLTINDITNDKLSDSNARGPGYFDGLRLAFGGDQTIDNVTINSIENHEVVSTDDKPSFDAPVSAIDQSDKNNKFNASVVTIDKVKGDKMTYGMKLKGTTSASAIHIDTIESKKTDAYGIYSENDLKSLATVIANIKAPNDAVGLSAKNADINSLSVSDLHGARNVAVIANGEGTVSINKTRSADSVVTLTGDVLANDLESGMLSMSLVNEASGLTGAVGFSSSTNKHVIDDRMTSLGTLDLFFNNKSRWTVTGNSYLTNLTANNDACIDLTNAGANDQWNKVTTKKLNGSNGIVNFGINLETESDTNVHVNQLIVNDKAEGTLKAQVTFLGTNISPDKTHSVNWLVSQGNDSDLTLTNLSGGTTFSGRGMLTVWNLGFVKEGDEALLDTDEGRQQISTQTNGNGKGKWYLVKSEHSQPDPNPNPNPPTPPVTPPLPPEVNDNITIGTSSGQAEAYQADMEDLRKRTGEIRYGAQDGGWVSVFGKKDSVKASGTAGFKQEIYGLNIGVDRLVHADEDSAWLFGGAFRYSDADQKGLGSGYTTGTLQEYSGKLYATWMHDKGSYADFVLQAGRYEQELEGFDNTGMDKSKADYGTWGFGASVEVGHMFSFGGVDDRRWFNHWFVEPQLQLSYFLAKGADYTTSTGLKVDQGNADFLTGRAGFVLGKKFNYGTIDDLDRRYFQVALLGGVKHEFLGGDQTISYTGVDGAKASVRAGDIDGTRFYYGVNCDWQVTENFRLYAQASREEGDRYTKDYDISIGGKLLF